MNSDINRTYDSKTGIGLSIFIILLLGFLAAISIINHVFAMLVIIAAVACFFLNVFLNTSYQITNSNKLIVKCGMLFNAKIDISSIKTIKASNSIMSAPALSFDRLEISYNSYDVILISPRDKKEFVNHLLEYNPNIVVEGIK